MFIGAEEKPDFRNYHYTIDIQGEGAEQNITFPRTEHPGKANDNINQTITNLFNKLHGDTPSINEEIAESIRKFLVNIDHKQLGEDYKKIYDSVVSKLDTLAPPPRMPPVLRRKGAHADYSGASPLTRDDYKEEDVKKLYDDLMEPFKPKPKHEQ